MFHQSSKQILLGVFVALLLITMPVYAVKKYKISNYEGGHQIWFEAEDYDERNPGTDEFYPVVDADGAFGQTVSRAGEAGGMIRWTFDISAADGKEGTWLFWARIFNPNNKSDYMLVEGDPDDAEIPTGPPFPGREFPQYVQADDRIFEETVEAAWGWWGDEEGSTKELQDGENTMYIFHRQGDETVFWDVFVWADSPDYVPTDKDYQNATIIDIRASTPSPANEALHEDTWVSLIWRPGVFAVSHDVYFGENFDDVNNGAEGTFYGNQTSASFVVGFPGFPFPDGLVPGTTYYWRIDEVNDTEPNSPWKGPVWSFMVPPKTAYNPEPVNGAKFIDPNTDLGWAAGLGAKLHTVYFGDNFDDVNNAAGELPLGTVTYTPGPLELDKTYYWRVDEFNVVATHKGEVWSFTTAGAGGGVRADYFKGMNFNNYVLSQIDPQINFNWGSGAPNEVVGADNFSVRWTGEVEAAAFTETYTFYTNSSDGVRLWVDGQQLVDNWTDHGTTENRGTIDLVASNTYSVMMEYYENDDRAVAELRWSSPHTPKQLIPQAALSLPVKASRSKPANRAVDVKQTAILSWSAGEEAASHQVYFGTDEEAVKNADTGSPEYKGAKDIGSENYDPGRLEWDTTYYWRVDEVEADGTIRKGNVWSFTTANFLIIDDFEDYDTGENQIWYAWKDGLGYGTPGTEPYFAGNGSGSAVGDENTGSYTEETIVHGGRQAMPLLYDNNQQGYFKYSEVEMTLSYPRDWTEKGVSTLTIWFRGNSGNAAESLYVALNGSAVVSHDNPDAAQITEWTQWNIDLQQFADQDVNLANVNTIALGLGNKKNPLAGGAGTMYFDDIHLYVPEPETEPAP